MTRLHLLGFTPDLKGLVFTGRRGGKRGTYWVPVDKAFRQALDQLEEAREERRSGGSKRAEAGRKREAVDAALPRATPSSRLSPREVQRLLREGRSVRDVAKLAGVDEQWVERFMGPVVEEQAGVIQMTRSSYQDRARLGRSGLPIGEAVRRNLDQRKATADTLAQLEEGWSARRARAQSWTVRLRFRHRGKRRTAEWEFRKDTRAVRPRNQLARELGWWPAPTSRSKKSSAKTNRKGGKRSAPRKVTKRKPTPRKATKRKASRKATRRGTATRKAAKRPRRKRP